MALSLLSICTHTTFSDLDFVIMRLIVRQHPGDAAEYVAAYIIKCIKEFDPNPGRRFVLGLPTGSSPIGVYNALVQKYTAGEVSICHTAFRARPLK